MNKLNKQLLLSFVILQLVPVHAQSSFFDDIFKEISEFETRMHNHFTRMRQLAHSSDASGTADLPEIHINHNSEQSAIDITVQPLTLTDKKCEAAYDAESNKLSVETPSGSLVMHVTKGYLIIDFNYKASHNTQKKDHAVDSLMEGFTRHTQWLNGNITLDHANINYDGAHKGLKISLPFKKKATTKIPVNFKD